MNADTIWQLVRYTLIAAGAFVTGRGWANEVQWEALMGFVGVVLPAAWGFYVKWRTTPVLDKTIIKENIASVSSATGEAVAAPKKEH